jgi:hypothetical protein
MMTEENEVEIAMTILNKVGIIENRALIVYELEEELATIYSELDDATLPSSSDTPIQYNSVVQTEFDLISNGEIHRSLYKVITKEQRSFLRKITHHEDFYINVNRGEGYNFVQEWYFNIRLKKEDFLLDYDKNISFYLRVGVRDLFPYEIEIDSFTNQIEYSTLLNHFKN